MAIPTFMASIIKCHEVLMKKDINLLEIITDDDSDSLSDILKAFVGITAIQV